MNDVNELISYIRERQHPRKGWAFITLPTEDAGELCDEIERLRSRFTKLDMPRYSGAPMLDKVLAQPNDEFRVWAYTLPPEYWARYDLSAARIGWEGAKGTLKGSE